MNLPTSSRETWVAAALKSFGRLAPALGTVVFAALLTGCDEYIPLTLACPGGVCAPCSIGFTAARYGAPAAGPMTGLPPTLTFAPATLTITGTPAWNDFGTYNIAVSGTYPAARWYQDGDWSASGTLTIASPVLTFAPAGPLTINPGQTVVVSLTVTPPCAYTVALANDSPVLLQINPSGATVTTAPNGTVQLRLRVGGTPPAEGATALVTATITPRAPSTAPPATTTLTVRIP